MIKIKDNYVLDQKGKTLGVFLDIKGYRRLVKQAEELQDIKAFDEAKASKEKPVSFDLALKAIKKNRG